MISRTKTMIACLCCICLLIPLFMSNNTVLANTPKKKRIAVIDFENRTSLPQAGAGISELFVVELVKNKNFEVIERQRLQHVLQEQRLGATGAVTEDSAAQLGKLLGLDYLVYGAVVGIEQSRASFLGINQSKMKVTLAMKLVDATTGSIVFAETASESVSGGSGSVGALGALGVDTGGLANVGTISNELGGDAAVAAAIKAVTKLVDKINEVNPLEGVVVQINDNTVYIDLGREQGVKTGQIYEIFSEGKVITHPTTGKILGVERIKMGEVKITSVEAQMSIGQKQAGVATVGSKVRKIK